MNIHSTFESSEQSSPESQFWQISLASWIDIFQCLYVAYHWLCLSTCCFLIHLLCHDKSVQIHFVSGQLTLSKLIKMFQPWYHIALLLMKCSDSCFLDLNWFEIITSKEHLTWFSKKYSLSCPWWYNLK